MVGPLGIEPNLTDYVARIVSQTIRHSLFVGLLGIEPSLYEPESYVLPVYYSPTKSTWPQIVRTIGIRWPEMVLWVAQESNL
jgi:hypothetical protein